MKPGLKLYLAALPVAAVGVGGMLLMQDTPYRTHFGILMLVCLIVAVVLMALGMYAMEHPYGKLPVKKVLVCTGIMLLAVVLSGVFAALMPEPSGWKPVGNDAMEIAFPLALGVIACLWYWNKAK